MKNIKDGWNYNMDSCPLKEPVYLLSSDQNPFLPQSVFVGTIIFNGKIHTKDRCIQGDPKLFFRSKLVAWKPFVESPLDDKDPLDEPITLVECRELRKVVHELTFAPVLTKRELLALAQILNGVLDRLEKENDSRREEEFL